MKQIIISGLLLAGIAVGACGGKQTPKMTDDEIKTQVDQLMVLYTEARPKFVIQKEKMQKDEDCYRVTALRTEIDKRADKQAMLPEKDDVLMKVQMEMQQAAEACLAK